MNTPIVPSTPVTVRRNRKPPGSIYTWVVTLLILAIGAAGVATALWLDSLPSKEETAPFPEGLEMPVSFQGEWQSDSAKMIDGQLYLPLNMMNEWIERDLVWDEKSSNVILTSLEKVIRMESDQLTAFVNDEPFPIRFPVTVVEGRVYIPVDPVAQWVGLNVTQPADQVVLVQKHGEILIQGEFRTDPEQTEPYPIRLTASKESPIVAYGEAGEFVRLFGEQEGWYKVQKPSGEIGYALKNDVVLSGKQETVSVVRDDQRPYLPWRPVGGKIHMTWEYVYSKTVNPDKLRNLDGLNVVSPTWFELIDGEGNISSKADLRYVRWAHKQGFQVWGLFGNGFDPDRTNQALATFESRQKMTKQLLAYAEMYELDGINIDFENVYLKDKQALVQWVREVTPLLHDQGLVVSMDITIKSLSETWSLFYDRPALGEVVDYLVLMAYDEHWGSSPKAGSVASLPWVEAGVRQLIEVEGIPPAKIILGVPFYTRVWTEEQIDGKIKVKSKAVSMPKAEQLIRQNGADKIYLQETGQFFASWVDEDVTYKIWLEDARSMQQRVDLVHQYRLAGIASWRRGFESSEIIPGISNWLKHRP